MQLLVPSIEQDIGVTQESRAQTDAFFWPQNLLLMDFIEAPAAVDFSPAFIYPSHGPPKLLLVHAPTDSESV